MVDRERSVRMPLQTGATAFRSIALSCLFAALAFSGCLLPVVYLTLRDALRWRASDVVFGPRGFRIVGGRRGGAAWAYDDVGVAMATFEQTSEYFVKHGDSPPEYFHRLEIDGDVVAQTADREENASVRAVFDAIRSAAYPEPPPAAPRGTVMRCPSCGAPAAPADADVVRCAYCGGAAPVAPSLRWRIREASERDVAARAVQAAARRAVVQGSAARTNLALAIFAASSTLGFPLSEVLLFRAPYALGIPVALVVVAAGYAALCIAHRRAFRSLVFGCSAIESDDPRRAPACRGCHGPLPAPGSGLVVTCVYCGNPNLIGLAFGRVAATTASERFELRYALAQQRRAIRGAMAILCAGAVLVLLAVLFAVYGPTYLPGFVVTVT